MGIPGPPQERLITHTGPPNDTPTTHAGPSQERLTTYGGAQRPISIKIEPDTLLNKLSSAERTNQGTLIYTLCPYL